MFRRLTLLALAVPLALASPALAQSIGPSAGPVSRLGPSIVPTGPASAVRLGPGTSVGGPAAVGIVSTAFTNEEGDRDVRKGVIGSWEVDRDVRLGLGLLSVSRYSPREPDFRKTSTVRDMGGRKQRIAALGLSIDF